VYKPARAFGRLCPQACPARSATPPPFRVPPTRCLLCRTQPVSSSSLRRVDSRRARPALTAESPVLQGQATLVCRVHLHGAVRRAARPECGEQPGPAVGWRPLPPEAAPAAEHLRTGFTGVKADVLEAIRDGNFLTALPGKLIAPPLSPFVPHPTGTYGG
jgi:hypothetical protein